MIILSTEKLNRMDKKLTPSDVFDTDPKTGALILGANRLDDYATKVLRHWCAQALTTPMPLPVEQIIQEAGLTIKTASLSRDLDIFGCCLLLDGYVDIYNPTTDEYTPQFFPADTLLFDPNSEWAYGEGCKRNTLIHEFLHWEKDKAYFRILSLKNRKAKEQLYPIMCRLSRSDFEPAHGKRTKQNEVQWLEWQAHKLAPRLLMPRDMFRRKAHEFLDAGEPSCDELINHLAEFFIVSRASVKIRLLEVGLESRIAQLQDYENVYSDLNRVQEYVPISMEDALRMLQDNVILEDWVESRGFVFVDGYFVLPDKKYIAEKNGAVHLTKYARQNLPVCAINIREQHVITYKYLKEDLSYCAVLYKTEPNEIDQRFYVFSPRNQATLHAGVDKKEIASTFRAAKDALVSYDEEVEKELLRKIADEDTTLCDCLWFLITNKGWDAPLDFYDHTLVHENYYGRIRDNKINTMESDTLMAICVGLGLRLRLTEKLFDKAERCKLHFYEDPDKTRIQIMETYPGISIYDFNRLLEVSGMKKLGTVDRPQKKKN